MPTLAGPERKLAALAAMTVGLVCSLARAADAPPPVLETGPALPAMTLAEALAYARARQPSLQSALARVAAAAAETRIPRAQWLPSFGATVQAFEGTANNSTASYLGVPEVDLPRIGGTKVGRTWTPSTSTLAAIGAGQEIFDFGRIAAQAAVADVAYETERHRADAERLRVELVVKEAYYGVAGAHAVLRAAEDAFTRAQVHRDMAAAGVRSGLHAPIELTRAEADLTRFDVGRIRARGSVQTSQAVFAAAVGFEGRMLDAAGARDGARDGEQDGAQDGRQDGALPVPPLEQGLRQALERDPVLEEARSRVKGGEALTRAIAAELRPDLALTATLSDRAGTAASTNATPVSQTWGPLPAIPNWDAGLVLRLPLYDPVVSARREAAATRVEAARADVSALSQQEAAAVPRRGPHVSPHRRVVTVGGSLVFAGCFPLPADFAIQRASQEFHCPPEKIGVVQRGDVADYVYDLEACGQRVRYACLSFEDDDLLSLDAAPTECVREPDPPKRDPDPIAVASLPRLPDPIQRLRSTAGEARRICRDQASDRYADDCIFREHGSWRAHANEDGAGSGMTHQ